MSDAHSLTIRPLTLDDVAAVNELIAAGERFEPADNHWNVEEVRENLTGPDVDLPRGSVGIARDGELIAFGYLGVLPVVDIWKAYATGEVHPDHLERGHGRTLMTTLLDQARALRAEAAPDLPAEVRLWIPERRPRANRLAESMGFEVIRWFRSMGHEMAELPETQPLAAGFALTEYTPEIDDQVRLASNESFADHFGSTPVTPEFWHSDHLGSSSFRPAQSVLAVDDQGVAAFVIAEEFDAETEANGFRTGYIARVGTVPRARGRGLASALVVETLHRFAAAGYRRAELTVDSESPTGAGRIYSRLGFAPTHLNIVRSKRI